MSRIDELKSAIEGLSPEEFAGLVQWVSEKDWDRWDEQIEADSAAGRLDFLVNEVLDEKSKGSLREL